MRYFHAITLFWVLMVSPFNLTGQDRIERIKNELEIRIVDAPGLDEIMEISTNNVSLQEFIRGIGMAHNLNVSVSDDLTQTVVNNFSDARVMDVFVFLCKTYELEIKFTGTIFYFEAYVPPLVKKELKPLKILYNEESKLLTLDLKNDTLSRVVEELTRISPYAILMAPGISDQRVSIYIEKRPVMEVMRKLAFTNNLRFSEEGEDYFIFMPAEIDLPNPEIAQSPRSGNQARKSKSGDNLFISTDKEGLITVSADDVPLVEVIDGVSNAANQNYFLYDKLVGNGQLHIEKATFNDFLSYLLNGSDYTFKKTDGVYLIGNRKLEGLRATELIKIENRVVENVLESIPEELKSDVDIKVFEDLNGLIVSGSAQKIEELKLFINEIDQIVPMVAIELIIVDLRKSDKLSAGVNVGVGGPNVPAVSTGGYGSGGLNATLNSTTINNVLSTINGFGSINLGQVTPDFYMSLEALESEGYIKTRMKPKLSALNGQKSELSIGSTEYYLEVTNDIIGTQNPIQSQSQKWIETKAELKVAVTPTVSSDGQVTLEIEVTQSDFTERSSTDAPPGTVNRTFTSKIRVLDGDMILVGGLEDKTLSKSRSGLPFLSKIPVIGWLFGKQQREKSISTLNIFLRPRIDY